MGRELSAAAAGDGVDGRLVVRVDGGDCVGPPSAVQQVCVLHHLGAILEVFSNKVSYHVGGEAEDERGHEVRARPVVRRQQSLHLPHHIWRLHVSDFRKLQQLESSGPVVLGVPGNQQGLSCSYASAAFSSISLRLSLMLLQTSVGRADSRWSYFVDDWDMLQILTLLSSLQNQVVGSCGQKSGSWMPRGPRAGFALLLLPFCMITKECGLEVDCSRVQERAYAKALHASFYIRKRARGC